MVLLLIGGNPSFKSFWGFNDKLLYILYEYVVWNCIQYDLRSAPMLWQWGTSCGILHIILDHA